MLSINGKKFMNISEAVQWLLDNNALPFQSTASFAPDTEIAKNTIINPSPAEIKIGSLVLFADGKVGTVSGITSNGFTVGQDATDLADGVPHITDIDLDASDHLVFTMSEGDPIDAGLVKEISGFSIDASQHLIANYNDGTTQDLGAIFTGNVNIAGNFTANSIIENMAGYDMEVSQYSPPGVTIAPIYFGICKNGNKLTLVSFFSVTRTAVIGAQQNTLFYITIPSAVGAQIYPFTLGEFNNVVAINKTPAVTDIAQANNVDFKYYLRKQSNSGIVIHCRTLDDLALNTQYLVRIEVTFLLSQNYAV